MSGKIPSKTTFTRELAAAITAMDVLAYLDTNGKAALATGYSDVDFVLPNISGTAAGSAVTCDPQPSIANLTCYAAISAGDKLLAAPAGSVRTFPGHAGRTFTAANTDIVTLTAHGFVTGDKVRVTTSAADLPAGLAVDTDYFVVVIDADTFKLASSLANAIAESPTVVDITDAGTGTHTMRMYGEITLVGKALEDGVEDQKIGVMFDKRYVILP